MIEIVNERFQSVLEFNPRRVEFPYGWCGHIPFAAWLVKQLRPEALVELGTHSGNSYFSFCQAVQEYGLNTRCYAVDTWEGDQHSGGYGKDVFLDVSRHNDNHYSRFSNLMRMTFDNAIDYFSDGSIDLLHIDGLHTHEAVKLDFTNWLPKLSSKAVVLFHDINVRERDFGVWRLWDELKRSYPSCEFPHSHGLGVLVVGSNLDPVTQALIENCNSRSAQLLFSLAGELVVLKAERQSAEFATRDVIRSPLQVQIQEEGADKQEQVDLEALNGSLRQMSLRVTEMEREVACLTTALASNELQHSNQNRQMVPVQNAAVEVGSVNGVNKNLSELNVRMGSLYKQLVTLEYNVVLKNAHISALSNSASWRVTAPVRWVAKPFIRVVRSANGIRGVIQRNGGVIRTGTLAYNVLQQQGMPALLGAIKFAIKQPIIWKNGLEHSGAVGFGNSSIPDNRNDYTEWVRRYDTLTAADRERMREVQAAFTLKPLISVVMPTYNPRPEWLVEAIESVRRQIYTHWEMCIADDASTDPDVRAVLESYASKDERIKVVFREKNGHISAASNSALEVVEGDWVALLDHDDLLSETALFWVTHAINKNPIAKLIYSDEDKIGTDGFRRDPYFKCDWNPDLFYSHNMICHLGVYSAGLVNDIGGFRLGFEGAQDYDLALRCIERIESAQIVHIPRILYHWRVHLQSTASSSEAKPYAALAGERAINEHFARMGFNGGVRYADYGYIPSYEIPPDSPLVSIIIPTRNGGNLLKKCISSILGKTSYKNYEILVVDNGSDQHDTLDYLGAISELDNVVLLRDDAPFNYSKLNNGAVLQARGEIVALVNDDVEVISPDWLGKMVMHALRPDVGAVGAKLWYTNKTLQHGGVIIGIGGVAGHSHKYASELTSGYFSRLLITQSLSAVTAACLVIRKSIYNEMGGLEEERLRVAFNDVDFCLRVREAGYRNVWTPEAELFHHESASRGQEDTPEKKARFASEMAYMQERWHYIILNDPAYSPNLTLDYEDFSYAWPPRVKAIQDLGGLE